MDDDLRAFLAAIVESSDDAIIGLNLRGQIFSWNRGAEQIYGYSSNEVVGRPISVLSLPERTDEVSNMQHRLLSGQPIRHLRTIHLDKGGKSLFVSLSVSPVINRYHEILGASVLVRDITQQLQAEESLRDAEEKYRQLFCAEQDAILLIEKRSGRIRDANAAAVRLYGTPLTRLLQLKVTDLCRNGLPAASTGQRFIGRHQSENGHSFDAEISLGQFRHKGLVLQVMIVRDISESLQAARLRQELALAKGFQQRLLPSEAPQLSGYDIHAATSYCKEAGGDYYDFFLPAAESEAGLAFAVGDVSGHGVGSALLMALTKGVLQNEAGHSLRCEQRLFQSLNRQLISSSDESSFLTLFFGRIDTRKNVLHWNSAGHGPVFCYRASPGRIVEFPPNDIPLGIDPRAAYTSPPSFTLQPGDILLIGTDGLWETRNPQGEMYRTERLRQIIASHSGKAARAIHGIVMDKVTAFRQGAEQEDDMTLMVIKVEAL